MAKFYDCYNSLKEVYNSIFRGNEIEFKYKNKKYFLLPCFDNSNHIFAIRFGSAYSDDEKILSSEEDLWRVALEGTFLSEILEDVDIVFRNF